MRGRKRPVFPDAAQRASGATLIRDRSGLGARDDPGSAARHFVLRCARETGSERLPRAYGLATSAPDFPEMSAFAAAPSKRAGR